MMAEMMSWKVELTAERLQLMSSSSQLPALRSDCTSVELQCERYSKATDQP